MPSILRSSSTGRAGVHLFLNFLHQCTVSIVLSCSFSLFDDVSKAGYTAREDIDQPNHSKDWRVLGKDYEETK